MSKNSWADSNYVGKIPLISPNANLQKRERGMLAMLGYEFDMEFLRLILDIKPQSLIGRIGTLSDFSPFKCRDILTYICITKIMNKCFITQLIYYLLIAMQELSIFYWIGN